MGSMVYSIILRWVEVLMMVSWISFVCVNLFAIRYIINAQAQCSPSLHYPFHCSLPHHNPIIRNSLIQQPF